jgi:hypothetical protein
MQPISALDDAPNPFRFHHHKVRVRSLWLSKQLLEQDFLMAIPSARRLAVEHLVQHAVPTLGTESAIPVESGHAINAGPTAQFAPDFDPGCVVVGKIPGVKPFLGLRFSHGPQRPNAPEA